MVIYCDADLSIYYWRIMIYAYVFSGALVWRLFILWFLSTTDFQIRKWRCMAKENEMYELFVVPTLGMCGTSPPHAM